MGSRGRRENRHAAPESAPTHRQIGRVLAWMTALAVMWSAGAHHVIASRYGLSSLAPPPRATGDAGAPFDGTNRLSTRIRERLAVLSEESSATSAGSNAFPLGAAPQMPAPLPSLLPSRRGDIPAAQAGAAAQSAPRPPQRVSATTIGSTVTLTWIPPSIGDAPRAYVVEAAHAPGGPPIVSGTVPDTRIVVPNVPNGVYFVRVRSATSAGVSDPSDDVIVVVPGGTPDGCGAPPEPAREVVGHVSRNIATVQWAPASRGCPTTSYVVEVGSSPGASNLALVHTADTKVSAAAPDGTYYVRIIALNPFGASPPQDVVLQVPCAHCRFPAAHPEPGRSPAPAPPPAPSPGPAPRPSAPPSPPPPPPTPSGENPDPTCRGGTLRMMTWNIHHGKSRSGRYDIDAQARFIASHDPHVVALQEVQTWNENQPSRFKALLERYTGVSWSMQWAPVVDTSGTEGNVILTRLPVVSSRSHQMHATSDHTAMYSNRSVAQATVLVGCVRVHVFSTHLDYYNTSHRTTQLHELMRWAEQFGPRRIIGGDFNSWWGEYWPRTMRERYHDTWYDVTRDFDGGYTVNDAVRFDYLFRSKSGAEQVLPLEVYVPRTSLSDHNPVIAIYRVIP